MKVAGAHTDLTRFLSAAALSAASFTGLALAQSGLEGPFTVDNATEEKIIVG